MAAAAEPVPASRVLGITQLVRARPGDKLPALRDEWERYRYLAEAFRVLRPGGRVYVDNINLLSPEGWTIFTQTMRMDPLARPVNVSKTSTPEELSWFATQAGFVVVHTRGGSLWITAIARKPDRLATPAAAG